MLLAHTFAGFFAPILLVKFPWIQKLPIAALQTDGVAKQVAHRIGSQILKDNAAESSGKDILSILLDNQKHNRKESERLSDETLLANVSSTPPSFVVPFTAFGYQISTFLSVSTSTAR